MRMAPIDAKRILTTKFKFLYSLFRAEQVSSYVRDKRTIRKVPQAVNY